MILGLGGFPPAAGLPHTEGDRASAFHRRPVAGFSIWSFRFGRKGGVRPATDAARLAAPSPLGATKILDVHNIRSSGGLSIFET